MVSGRPELLLLLLLLSVQGGLDGDCSCLLGRHDGRRVLLLLVLLLLADQLVHSVLVFLNLLVEEESAPLGYRRLRQEVEVVEVGGG